MVNAHDCGGVVGGHYIRTGFNILTVERCGYQKR